MANLIFDGGVGGGEIAKESSLADQNQNGLKKTHPQKNKSGDEEDHEILGLPSVQT